MRSSRPRWLLPSVVLLVACEPLPRATGECGGSFLTQPVRWPLEPDNTDFNLLSTGLEGETSRYVHLVYRRGGTQQVGVDIALASHHVVDERTGPREVSLQRVGPGVGLEAEPGLVLSWQGYQGSPDEGYGTGYPAPPGPPRDGTLHIDWLDDTRFAGHYVYRYEDGSALRCAFDVPR